MWKAATADAAKLSSLSDDYNPEPMRKIHPTSADGYELQEQIGQGTAATVYKAWCEQAKEFVAIKVVDLEWFQTSLEEISKEIQVMSLSAHPNVVPYSTSFVHGHDLWVVMPLLTGGSVSSLIRCMFPNGLDEPLAQYILHESLKALEYFHSQGQIHRDVKAANIMLDSKGNVMLSDYGVMGWMVEGGMERKMRQTFVGTPCWMAPEVMEQVHGYDYKADMWSFGITAIEIAQGCPPYIKHPPMKVLLLTLQNPPPTLEPHASAKYSKNFKDMLDFCLQKDPAKRPSATQLLKHKFFKNVKRPTNLVEMLQKLPPLGSRAGTQVGLYQQLQKVATGGGKSGIWDRQSRGLGWDFDVDDEESTSSVTTTEQHQAPPQQPPQQQQGTVADSVKVVPAAPPTSIAIDDIHSSAGNVPYSYATAVTSAGVPGGGSANAVNAGTPELTSSGPMSTSFESSTTTTYTSTGHVTIVDGDLGGAEGDSHQHKLRKGRFMVSQVNIHSNMDDPRASTNSEPEFHPSESPGMLIGHRNMAPQESTDATDIMIHSSSTATIDPRTIPNVNDGIRHSESEGSFLRTNKEGSGNSHDSPRVATNTNNAGNIGGGPHGVNINHAQNPPVALNIPLEISSATLGHGVSPLPPHLVGGHLQPGVGIGIGAGGTHSPSGSHAHTEVNVQSTNANVSVTEKKGRFAVKVLKQEDSLGTSQSSTPDATSNDNSVHGKKRFIVKDMLDKAEAGAGGAPSRTVTGVVGGGGGTATGSASLIQKEVVVTTTTTTTSTSAPLAAGGASGATGRESLDHGRKSRFEVRNVDGSSSGSLQQMGSTGPGAGAGAGMGPGQGAPLHMQGGYLPVSGMVDNVSIQTMHMDMNAMLNNPTNPLNVLNVLRDQIQELMRENESLKREVVMLRTMMDESPMMRLSHGSHGSPNQ